MLKVRHLFYLCGRIEIRTQSIGGQSLPLLALNAFLQGKVGDTWVLSASEGSKGSYSCSEPYGQVRFQPCPLWSNRGPRDQTKFYWFWLLPLILGSDQGKRTAQPWEEWISTVSGLEARWGQRDVISWFQGGPTSSSPWKPQSPAFFLMAHPCPSPLLFLPWIFLISAPSSLPPAIWIFVFSGHNDCNDS